MLEFMQDFLYYWRSTVVITVVFYMLPTIIVIQSYKAWKRRHIGVPVGAQIESAANTLCYTLTQVWVAGTVFLCIYYLATGDY